MHQIHERSSKNVVKDIVDIRAKVDSTELLMVSIEVVREEKKVHLVTKIDEGYTFLTDDDINNIIKNIKIGIDKDLSMHDIIIDGICPSINEKKELYTVIVSTLDCSK